jgi:hypothetical protein
MVFETIKKYVIRCNYLSSNINGEVVLNNEEMSNSKILKKLGLNEFDLEYSMRLFAEVDPSTRRTNHHFSSHNTRNEEKIEKIMGYSINRLRRAKALRLMGVTEEEIDLENSKNLGALGTGGRKRSFMAVSQKDQDPFLCSCANEMDGVIRRRVSVDNLPRNRRKSNISNIMRRRKSSTDVRTLKRAIEQMNASLQVHATSTHLEVIKLRERVKSLEEEIKDHKVIKVER